MLPAMPIPNQLTIPATTMINQPVFAERLVSLREGQIVLTSIKVCHQRVSTCYGCGQFLKTSGSVASHLDVVVVSKLRRKYFKGGEHHTSNKASNVYFKVHGYTFEDGFWCVLQKFAESQITLDKQKNTTARRSIATFYSRT